ncbi:MAG: SOS response-associated peptidase [Parvibaculales bacterium]
MCGRFALTTPPESLRKLLDFTNQPNFPARYNIAPTQPVQIIRQPSGACELATVRWGLVPGWMKPEKVAESQQRPQHNARGETVAEKPFFKQAFAARRCLIPADAFYEWNPKSRQPFCVRRRDEAPFMMAGLWEFWEGADGSEIESCAVITTEANETLSEVHHRMPVMLEPGHWGDWLGAAGREVDSLVSLLRPAPETDFHAYPISKDVNKVSNDTSALWHETVPAPPAEKPQLDLF